MPQAEGIEDSRNAISHGFSPRLTKLFDCYYFDDAFITCHGRR